MSDDATNIDDGGADGSQETASAEEQQEQKPPPNFEADAKKWKAMFLKKEAEAKANSDAASKLKEMEHAGKSESEKLQLLLDEERTARKAAEVRALKRDVAADKGLPPALAKFLPDVDNEVDMMQAADDLLEASGSTGKAEQSARQPKSNLTNPLGSDDDDAAATSDALLKSMLGRAV